MAKVMVVTRHLKGYHPVVLCVIKESPDSEVTDQENYMHGVAADEINHFKSKFVEFKDAEFYIELCDLI